MDHQTLEQAVCTLITAAGDDPTREGLRDTPARVAKAYAEWFSGYRRDARAVLQKTFSETDAYDQMIVLRAIRFHSHCEHHLAPFTGTATVGYLPKSRVVGISKLAEVVDIFARRLQLQERMTQNIAVAIHDALKPLGVGVLLRAQHTCMTSRGCAQRSSDLVTSALLGRFREPEVRAEFLQLSGLT